MKYPVLFAYLSLLFLCMPEARADSPFRLSRADSSIKSLTVGATVVTDSVLRPFEPNGAVSGVSIDGWVTKTSPDYLVCIILKDKEGGEHLLMESYEELNSSLSFSFSDYCMETALLENIQPECLKIVVRNAELYLERLRVAPEDRGLDQKQYEERKTALRKEQVSNTVNRINAYNRANNKLWAAGETELALQDYTTRMRMLGLPDEANSCGIEYYVGGIFEFGHQAERQRININSPYVDHFDWRDRHGKNWMTSVKFQENSSFCVVFGVLGSLEAVTNLYYNRKLDLDLSESEIIDCADNHPHHYNEAFSDYIVYNYLINHGVCDNVAYPTPYGSLSSDPDTLYCKSDIITPNEQIRINDYSVVSNDINQIKANIIFKGPLLSGWLPSSNSGETGHAMVLVGYNTIKANDTIRYHDPVTNQMEYIGIIGENDPRIGLTYWIFKNSYGSFAPYINLIFSEYPSMTETTIPCIYEPRYIVLPLTSQNLNNYSIVWEDADGDGYYYWGIGSKPYSCPSWIPDIPDGDDSDPTKGPIDEYGFFYTVEGHGTCVVTGNASWEGSETLYGGIRICSNSTLTLNGNRTLLGNNKIEIEQNGKLILNGGVLANAEFVLNPPCTIRMINGGAIYMKANCNFEPPIGCVVEINRGVIGNMNKINWHTWCENPYFY